MSAAKHPYPAIFETPAWRRFKAAVKEASVHQGTTRTTHEHAINSLTANKAQRKALQAALVEAGKAATQENKMRQQRLQSHKCKLFLDAAREITQTAANKAMRTARKNLEQDNYCDGLIGLEKAIRENPFLKTQENMDIMECLILSITRVLT